MEVQFTGNVRGKDFEDKIVSKLDEIVVGTAERLMDEQEGLRIKEGVISGATFTIAYDVEGMEESQLLTVEHHKGHPEVLKWVVDLDAGESSSNEEASAYDDYTVAAAYGMEKEFEEVETLYDAPDLVFVEEENFGNMDKVTLQHKDGFLVIRVYQNKKLIQEYKATPKDPAED